MIKIDKFIEWQKLPNLSQGEIHKLHSLMTTREIEFLVKLSTKSIPGLDDISVEWNQTIKEEIMPILLKLFNIIEDEGPFHENTIYYPVTKTRHRHQQFSGCISYEHRSKTFSKILRNWILRGHTEQYKMIKRSTYKEYIAALNMYSNHSGVKHTKQKLTKK